MSSSFHPGNLQALTLQAFTVLCMLRSDWPGSLILNVGLDDTGSALSLAANIAGAVCLTLEPDPALARNALRTGACDFVVNTLDEALRAIKNEIRQHRPLSVGLEGDPIQILDEIVARGLAPQLFTAPETYPTHAAQLEAFGTQLLSFTTPSAALILEAFLTTHPWTLQTLIFPTATDLHAFDVRALHALSAEDALRRKWLTAAPRIFPRDRTRTLWLTPAEAENLSTPKTP